MRFLSPLTPGVNIPHNFTLYSDRFACQALETSFMPYQRMAAPEQRAANRADCGECEEKCPQHIPVAQEIKKVHGALGGKGAGKGPNPSLTSWGHVGVGIAILEFELLIMKPDRAGR